MKRHRRKYKDLNNAEKLKLWWSVFSTFLLILNIAMTIKLWS